MWFIRVCLWKRRGEGESEEERVRFPYLAEEDRWIFKWISFKTSVVYFPRLLLIICLNRVICLKPLFKYPFFFLERPWPVDWKKLNIYFRSISLTQKPFLRPFVFEHICVYFRSRSLNPHSTNSERRDKVIFSHHY